MNMTINAQKAGSRLLLSGNEAIARAVWESSVRVCSGYPGTPATEILECLAFYPDLYSEWSVNEKVALEVAFGATMTGARAFCAMKHVGLNVASDPLMTITLTGVIGGLVIAVADDVGMSSSQNEQDSRYWGRFAHLPVIEPYDSQSAYNCIKSAFELSERFETPVLLRLTTRVCHVKSLVTIGLRQEKDNPGFKLNSSRWVMVPNNARRRVPLQFERDRKLKEFSENSDLNSVEIGKDKSIGFITSGPAYLHLKEIAPDASILRLGLSHPLPIEKIKDFSKHVERLVIVEETEPLIEAELRAEGLSVLGKDFLPRFGELTPDILKKSINQILEKNAAEPKISSVTGTDVFPRPPTLCAACPHLGIYQALSAMRNKVIIMGDIGCYTLGAGHPWNALDSCISMGASMGMALGIDKARGKSDTKKAILAVIGDSTFLHMGIQGLLNIVYNQGNITILILDNRTTGMTGGQNHPGTGRNAHGEEAPRVDFAQLTAALGVKKDRIKVVDSYNLPFLFQIIRDEIRISEPSVIITNRPCTLIEQFERLLPHQVLEDKCTGCGNCIDIGCPAITVREHAQEEIDGEMFDLTFAAIDSNACTGCKMCVSICGSEAITPIVEMARNPL
ncbi:Indolepyruvate oxidoreductase subunit IorA [Azospirillaceae bacterium]